MRSAIALAVLLSLAGCDRPPATCPDVPPVPAEAMPPAPVSEHAATWQPGYVDWDGSGYRFIGGRWIMRDGPDTPWMPGHWTRSDSGACRWVPAHWL